MINKLEINNFKCFRNTKPFEFSKINLLTGINGRGKSSLLQSILILSQSSWRNNNLRKLIINDELISLGNYDDIKNSETPRSENILFDITFDSPFVERATLQYNENPDEPLQADFISLKIISSGKTIVINGKDKNLDETIYTLSELLKKIHFVSADRLGPVKFVEKTNLPEFVHVGPRGEHTINILANSINLPVVNKSLYRGKDANSVEQQTIEWLGYILEGAKIDIGGKDKESSVLYMLMNNRNNSYAYKPANIGFGYSYILPLIVTGLIAKPGEIIIIENPEAHLHPRAQSKIAEFFTRVAASGVQIFVESHSEHILNGLRVSTLSPEINLDYSDLTIHYFDESFDSSKLSMDNKGKIANWPNGFFDQQEIDLASIFKFTR